MNKPNKFPRFATIDENDPISGKPNVSEPSETLKSTGWTRRQKPYRQHFNWLHRTTDLWLEWLDSFYDPSIITASVMFNQSLKTTDSPTFAGLTIGSSSISSSGTTANTWGLDNDTEAYPLLKNDAGTLRIRNKDDNDDASLIVKNLTVNGTTTTVNSEIVSIADNVITLNSDVTGIPSQDGGIEVERGDDTNASLIWNEGSDVWKAGLVGSEVQLADINYQGIWTVSSSNIYYNTGNVGIGITNPYYKLHVNGTAVATDTVGTNSCYAYNTAGEGTYIGVFKGQGALPGYPNLYYPVIKTDFNYMYFSAAGKYSAVLGGNDAALGLIDTNAAEKVHLHTNGVSYFTGGNVGIGTDSPANKLSIEDLSNSCFESIRSDTGILYLGAAKIGYSNYHAGISDAIKIIASSASYPLVIDHSNNQSIIVGTNDIERLRILGNGNVGIGITNPNYKLHVNGTAIATNIVGTNTCQAFNNAEAGTYIGVFKGQGSLPGYPSNYLPTIKTDFSYMYFSCGNAYSGHMCYANDTSCLGLRDNVRGETVRLTTNGNSYFNGGKVGIGITNPTYQLQLSTDSAAKPSTNTWTVASDIRVKKDVENFDKYGLSDLLKLRPVKFKYNGLAGFIDDDKINVGFIAQEVEQIMPEMVSSIKTKLNIDDEEEIDLKNVNTHLLTFAIIEALRELKSENDNLKSRVSVLESK
jgi:hypothetical protein